MALSQRTARPGGPTPIALRQPRRSRRSAWRIPAGRVYCEDDVAGEEHQEPALLLDAWVRRQRNLDSPFARAPATHVVAGDVAARGSRVQTRERLAVFAGDLPPARAQPIAA